MAERKQMLVRLYPDGRIDAETKGVKGQSCLKFMALLEQMMQASVVDSEFTKEFYEVETEVAQVTEEVQQYGSV